MTDTSLVKSLKCRNYRILSELRELSALMNVHNIFEENNTVYVVEENEDLIPFEEYVERSNGHLEWDIARPLFMPEILILPDAVIYIFLGAIA